MPISPNFFQLKPLCSNQSQGYAQKVNISDEIFEICEDFL
jgi:hypothetical protein